jgi:transposase
MAYRELPMTDVRELLRRWQSKQSIKSTSRSTGIDRKTVRRYFEATEALGVARDATLTDDVVHGVAQYVQARPIKETSEAWSVLAPHKDRIAQWLATTPPLKLTRVHQLLTRDGVLVKYPTLRRFAMKELEWGVPKATVRVDDPPPGQEAQINFAEMGRVTDPTTGKRRRLHVLIVTLSFSRHQFVWPTFWQTTDAVIEGLEAAWRFFGAMPRTLVPDNASSMIVSADPTSPRLGETFASWSTVVQGLLMWAVSAPVALVIFPNASSALTTLHCRIASSNAAYTGWAVRANF